MDLTHNLIFQPRTLAWIEQTSGGGVLPAVWFGCLHGIPARLVVGLRTESYLAGDDRPVKRFSLCWMRNSSVTGPSEETWVEDEIVRLSCHDGQLVRAHGALTLWGQLEKLTIGQRTFSVGQVDLVRLLGTSSRADA